MKPTQSLSARLRFSTKDVGKGFYRGTGTGSMGAHTRKGGYLIDWRKVRNYNVPDLSKCKLTPFVTRQINVKETLPDRDLYGWEKDNPELYDPDVTEQDLSVVRRKRAMHFLRKWRLQNPQQFAQYAEYQLPEMLNELDRWRSGGDSEVVERVRAAEAKGRMLESGQGVDGK